MHATTLIADSGSTKAEWCFLSEGKKKKIATHGLSPYFLNAQQIIEIVQNEVAVKLQKHFIKNIFFYGTGCSAPENAKLVK